MLLGFGALPSGVAARRPDGSVVDLSGVASECRAPDLMGVLAAGPGLWRRLRAAVPAAPPADPDATPLVPITPGDYTDFYACEHHAAALGRLLRPGQPPLPPAWRHLPLGYGGRASTVVVSGSAVTRPAGLRAGEPPSYGPTERLDVEVELGFVVGVGNDRGEPVPASRAEEHLFGAVLLNDWSARDIQALETVPLGPHTGKSFATSISAWVVPMDLLPRCPTACPSDAPAPYLAEDPMRGVDVGLALRIDGRLLSRTRSAHLVWSPAQLYAQLTVTGARTRPGDLLGSGTISGPLPGAEGSLAEAGLPWLADGQIVEITSPELGSVQGRVEPCRTTAA